MKTYLLWPLVGSALLAGSAWSQVPSTSGSEQAVAALEQQWLKSQQTNNPDLLAPLLADKFVDTSSEGKVTTTKAEALAYAKSEKWSSADYIDVKVVVYGNTAIATGGFKGKSREVDAGELRRAVAQTFHIGERCVVGEYGMTELSSQFWEATAADAAAPAGVYFEPPQPQDTNPVFGQLGLKSERATEYDVGLEQEIRRNVDVAFDERRLGDDAGRVFVLGADLEATAGDLVRGLERLVAVGHATEDDPLALPGREIGIGWR